MRKTQRESGEQDMSGVGLGEGFWVGDRAGKADVLLFSLLLIIYTSQYTSVCKCVSTCVCVWVCVFVHKHNILDKASVRCHFSEMPLFM